MIILGVGLLQQSAPELSTLRRVNEQQLPVLHRQPVVNHHVQPLAELPELQRDSDTLLKIQLLYCQTHTLENKGCKRGTIPTFEMFVLRVYVQQVAHTHTHTNSISPKHSCLSAL